MDISQSPRPRCNWHQYSKRGIYLITIVVTNREPLLGTLNMDVNNPGVVLSETGVGVEREWNNIPAYQAQRGRKIKVLVQCVMPDHFHGVIFVEEDMDASIGRVIRDFKSQCTQTWRTNVAGTSRLGQPTSVDTIQWYDKKTGTYTTKLFKNLSKKQRQEYFSTQPRIYRPLFDDNYDDSILWKRGQLQNMLNYVKDNPRRAILRKLFPDLFRSCLHVRIGDREFAAFGNLFLLKRPLKRAVMFHRFYQSPENLSLPVQQRRRYEDMPAFDLAKIELFNAARDGVVLVNPGISNGEKIIKEECFAQNLPMIHIQKEPIGKFWKPERKRFEACAAGTLLILSPYDVDTLGDVNGVASSSKYSIFHNINKLAAEIADFSGDCSIVR